MIQTLEAIIDDIGQVHLSQHCGVKGLHRALVTILEEPPVEGLETALLSESSLSTSTDWNKLEEDEAWSHLQ